MTGSNWYTDYKPATGGFCPKPARYALYVDGKRVGEYPTEEAAVQAATSGEGARQAEAARAHNLASAEEHEMARRLEDVARDEAERIADDQATPRQIEYINRLRAQRARSGETAGFMTYDGDPAKLTKAQASAYINSLTGEY